MIYNMSFNFLSAGAGVIRMAVTYYEWPASKITSTMRRMTSGLSLLLFLDKLDVP